MYFYNGRTSNMLLLYESKILQKKKINYMMVPRDVIDNVKGTLILIQYFSNMITVRYLIPDYCYLLISSNQNNNKRKVIGEKDIYSINNTVYNGGFEYAKFVKITSEIEKIFLKEKLKS